MADLDIIVSLHQVIPFIPMVQTGAKRPKVTTKLSQVKLQILLIKDEFVLV
jgi:hypothetical protein